MALYDSIGRRYAGLRQPDQRIAAAIGAALGDARSVVNIGAGAGSYEPEDRPVIAVEPSKVMIRQRPPGAAPCVMGTAEALPLNAKSVDAAMGILTLHHWRDLERGLAEAARVARRRAVFLTWVPDAGPFWLTRDYFPEFWTRDLVDFPSEARLSTLLERNIGPARIEPIPIPHDCRDGFLGAYWRRPEAYLDAEVRGAISSFPRIDPAAGLARLAEDLASGRWAERYGHLMSREQLDLGYRLAVCEIA